MSRMKPKEFYDVVIEVAIIWPGPIQGRLMHPYLARRAKKQPVTYYHDDLEPVLKRTLGVPLFQEQMLQIAMVMAGFSGTEAEELRRALSFHRSQERMQKVEVKLRRAMEHRRVTPEIIEQIIAAISSFALYGFPESHAISFAILAYGSAYLKAHYPAEFYVSLLNNQPMGFYAPATLVKDARRHGLKVRAVCVERSDWFCTIEQDDTIRLGFCVVQGLRREHAESIVNQRRANAYASIDDFKRRTPLHKAELRTLAEIGALNCFGKNRRDALWEIEKTPWENDLFASIPSRNAEPERALDTRSPLQPMTAIERLHADYSGMQLTTGPHPMSLIRPQLPDVWRATDLVVGQQGQRVVIAGNVICRQRPGTAKGFVFISLEDETGVSNAIVNPALFEKSRLVITQESFLIIEGKLQTTDSVLVVQARSIKALRHERLVGSASYDFH